MSGFHPPGPGRNREAFPMQQYKYNFLILKNDLLDLEK
jgi:hypothetical protein